MVIGYRHRTGWRAPEASPTTQEKPKIQKSRPALSGSSDDHREPKEAVAACVAQKEDALARPSAGSDGNTQATEVVIVGGGATKVEAASLPAVLKAKVGRPSAHPILALREGLCKWTLEEISKERWTYCLEQTSPEKPYCGHHEALAR